MKKKMIKNLLLIALMAVLCVAVGMTASALEPTGQCGDNVYWTFDETAGELVISGEGEMYDFDDKNYYCPWEKNRGDIRTVIINEGVTTIGDNAFFLCYNLAKATLPDSITSIGEQAFCHCVSLSEINIPSNVKTIEMAAFQLCFSLTDVLIPESVETIGELAFSMMAYPLTVTVKGMHTNLNDFALCLTPFETPEISLEEFVDIYIGYEFEGDESFEDEYVKYVKYTDGILTVGTIYCHAGSTAEAYAIENGVDYVLTHFFEGEWTYDYDNMIRYRKCIHCDELETEALETTGDSDVEIIEPVDPDTDFTVDVVEDYVIIEETISNNITTDFEIVKAFDINLKNKDGVHVQPDGTVKVKLPLDWSKDGVYKVYRVNDDGTLTDMNAYRQGSHMVFDTDHFSIYVIVDESEKTDAPVIPDEPQEEIKDNFFTRLLDLIKSFFDLIMSWFKK